MKIMFAYVRKKSISGEIGVLWRAITVLCNYIQLVMYSIYFFQQEHTLTTLRQMVP